MQAVCGTKRWAPARRWGAGRSAGAASTPWGAVGGVGAFWQKEERPVRRWRLQAGGTVAASLGLRFQPFGGAWSVKSSGGRGRCHLEWCEVQAVTWRMFPRQLVCARKLCSRCVIFGELVYTSKVLIFPSLFSSLVGFGCWAHLFCVCPMRNFALVNVNGKFAWELHFHLTKCIAFKVTNSCKREARLMCLRTLSALYWVENKFQMVRIVQICNFIMFLSCRMLYSKKYLYRTKNCESKTQIKWKELNRPSSGFHLSELLSLHRLCTLRRKADPWALLVLKWLNRPFWILQNNISHLLLREKNVWSLTEMNYLIQDSYILSDTGCQLSLGDEELRNRFHQVLRWEEMKS